jgi:hypothetical protein
MVVFVSAAAVIVADDEDKEEEEEDEYRLLQCLIISLVPAGKLLLGDREDSDFLNDESNRL